MKKITKYMLFAFALLLGLTVKATAVSASTLDYDFTGYYYERFDQNGNNYSSWRLEDYRIDGETAYCIEPGIPEENPNLSEDTVAKVNEVLEAIKNGEIEVKSEL